MHDAQTNMSFLETCPKCDKSMISEDGNTFGGMMQSVYCNGAYIYSTICWECVFAEEI